jgi:hypothetical protein
MYFVCVFLYERLSRLVGCRHFLDDVYRINLIPNVYSRSLRSGFFMRSFVGI